RARVCAGPALPRARDQVLRLLEPAHPEVNPAERVEVGAVARLARDGFLEQLTGFFEPDPALRPHVSEVVLRRRVVRPPLEELLERLLRFPGRARPLEGRAQAEQSFGAVGETRRSAAR